jgi:hypothetical protein
LSTVFISYSHKDKVLRNQLENHLAILKRQGVVDVWHDRLIKAGDEFDSAISAKLDNADVILLLVSSDFLSSSYIWDIELGKALERHKDGKARVIPVILRPCDWKETPFGKLSAAPEDGAPIRSSRWHNIDEALLDVVKKIRTALREVAWTAKSPTAWESAAPLVSGTAKRSADLEVKAPMAEQLAEPLVVRPIVKRRLAFKIKSPYEDEIIWRFPDETKLKGDKKIRIGRLLGNDLVIPNDGFVSRFHCSATILTDSIIIEDNNSTNGLFVDGVNSKSSEIKLNQKLLLGHTELVLIADD